MTATEIKEALAQGGEATRTTWATGTKVTQVPETEEYEKTLPDGSKEAYTFTEYDELETDWSLIESETNEAVVENTIEENITEQED